MADTIKVLDQHTIAVADTDETLYTVPASTVAVVSFLSVVNRAGTAQTFRVAIRIGGAAISNEQYVAFDSGLAAAGTAGDRLELLRGMTLGAGDIVTVRANATSVSFNLFGIERPA